MKSSRTPFAVALTALALAAPAAAQAKPAAPENWRAVSVADTEAQALASHGQSAPVEHAPRAESSDSGFDWASAGAGGGVAVALLASLAVAGVGGRGRVRTAR